MYQLPLALQLVKAAGTAGRVGYAPPASESIVIEELVIYANEAIAANGTDYVTFTVYVGSTSIATARATSSTAFSQGGVESFTLTGTESQRTITQSAPLSIRVAQAGSGKAVDMTFTPKFTRKNALTAV